MLHINLKKHQCHMSVSLIFFHIKIYNLRNIQVACHYRMPLSLMSHVDFRKAYVALSN